jgi:hypothetical protein
MRKSSARRPNTRGTDWQRTPSDASRTSGPVDGKGARCGIGQHAHPYRKVEGLVLCKRGGSSSLPGRIEEPCKLVPFAALGAGSGAAVVNPHANIEGVRMLAGGNELTTFAWARGRRRVDGVRLAISYERSRFRGGADSPARLIARATPTRGIEHGRADHGSSSPFERLTVHAALPIPSLMDESLVVASHCRATLGVWSVPLRARPRRPRSRR